MRKPTIATVHRMLQRHNALIVHFSGAPKGVGESARLFPDDLRHVANGNAMGGVSCSTVAPGDIFSRIPSASNGTGFVGVVIDLQVKESLIGVDPADCGSSLDVHKIRHVKVEKDIFVKDLDATMGSARTHYNEWVIRNFKVLGIFVALPCYVSVPYVWPPDVPKDLQGDKPVLDIQPISIERIRAEFPSLPMYTFNATQILRVDPAGFILIDHTDIYVSP